MKLIQSMAALAWIPVNAPPSTMRSLRITLTHWFSILMSVILLASIRAASPVSPRPSAFSSSRPMIRLHSALGPMSDEKKVSMEPETRPETLRAFQPQ